MQDTTNCRGDDTGADDDARGRRRLSAPALTLRRQLSRDGRRDAIAAREVVGAQLLQSTRIDSALGRQSVLRLYEPPVAPRRDRRPAEETDMDWYHSARAGLVAVEKALGFDATCRARATADELRANRLLLALCRRDESRVYGAAQTRKGFSDQKHRTLAGDRFLSRIDLIDRSAVLAVTRKMPKGAYLHVHFNACLHPSVLLDLAKGMERMFITSDLPLVSEDECLSFDRCELQLSILGVDGESQTTCSPPTTAPADDAPWRLYAPVPPPLRPFGRRRRRLAGDEAGLYPGRGLWPLADGPGVRRRACTRCHQPALGWPEPRRVSVADARAGRSAWDKFNGKTRMMKGLFNYESAYRTYTRLFLEDLVKENILYVEIRPNFMQSNQLFRDDGSGSIDNEGIMHIIIDVVSAFQAEQAARCCFFQGLKAIYCTPRVSEPCHVVASLDECLSFKKRWPEWIAGFDLVGEECKGRPLKDFASELLAFKKKCSLEHVDVPFLFHCGETLEVGTDTDDNLVDALLLGVKRIGHGYALARRPHIMQMMKARGVCVELCPIANEVLGLTPRIGGHAMYQLLANNVHCPVNSDNGTIFQSTLSHEFYQAMIGKADMDLFGWKQLVLWSMEHACLNDSEKDTMMRRWEEQWDAFLRWIEAEYGDVLASLVCS